MVYFIFDGTFEGFLTVIFNIYELKTEPLGISRNTKGNTGHIGEMRIVKTDLVKAKRVDNAIKKKSTIDFYKKITDVFLSEASGSEILIYQVIRKLLKSDHNIESNLLDSDIRNINNLSKKIGKEVHRMHAFVRFQKDVNDIYFAEISPDFNVLQLIKQHFEDRFKDQKWIIVDRKRQCAILYNQINSSLIDLNDDRILNMANVNSIENQNSLLWKTYLKSSNIESRKNLRHQLQQMPKKYWKNMTEKN